MIKLTVGGNPGGISSTLELKNDKSTLSRICRHSKVLKREPERLEVEVESLEMRSGRRVLWGKIFAKRETWQLGISPQEVAVSKFQ